MACLISANKIQTGGQSMEKITLQQTIKGTNFTVNIHFSNKNKECITDKILPLLESDLKKVA